MLLLLLLIILLTTDCISSLRSDNVLHPAYNTGCPALVRLNSCGACNMLLNRIISKHAYVLSGSKRKVRSLLVHRNYNNSYSATLVSTFSTSSENSGDNSEDDDSGEEDHEESYEEELQVRGYRERTSLAPYSR